MADVSRWDISVKILIVDDDPISRRINSQCLVRAGYEVLEASSGTEGLDLLAAGEPVVMCITDVMMPGISGLDFIKHLRSDPFLAQMPVMVCTCLDQREWKDAADSLGIAAYTSKPVNANHLRGKAAAILQDEPWPLAEISRTLMRLDIRAPAYFENLAQLEGELSEFAAKLTAGDSTVDQDAWLAAVSGLQGATQSLGVQRIATLLQREFEGAKDASSESRAGFLSALKRETAMLNRAIATLKSEQEQVSSVRGTAKFVTRSPSNKSRWRAAPVASTPARESEPAETAEARAEDGVASPETPSAAAEPESEPAANPTSDKK
jgi:CheY-like chemotaxis protein